MPGRNPNKKAGSFNALQLQAEIVRQELREAEITYDSQVAPFEEERKRYFKSVKEQGFSHQTTANQKDVMRKELSLAEQRRRLNAAAAKLDVLDMRQQWPQAQDWPQRAAFVRKWAPLWSRHHFVLRPRVAFWIWGLRVGLKISPRF